MVKDAGIFDRPITNQEREIAFRMQWMDEEFICQNTFLQMVSPTQSSRRRALSAPARCLNLTIQDGMTAPSEFAAMMQSDLGGMRSESSWNIDAGLSSDCASIFQSESPVGSARGVVPEQDMDQAPREVAKDQDAENSTQSTFAAVHAGVRDDGLSLDKESKGSANVVSEDFELEGPINSAKDFEVLWYFPVYNIMHLHCTTMSSSGTLPTADTQSAQPSPIDGAWSGEMSPPQQVVYSGFSSPCSPPTPVPNQATPFIATTDLQDNLRDSPDWSIGTELHSVGKCRPCAFRWSEVGCANGARCHYCHESHDIKQMTIRPCKGKRKSHRKNITAIETALGATPDAGTIAATVAAADFPARPFECSPGYRSPC